MIRVAFLVNGEPQSAMGVRAQSFAARLQPEFEIRTGYRSGSKVAAIWHFIKLLAGFRPQVCYVFDMAYSGVLAAGTYRLLSRCRMIVDTGDAIYELSRNTGSRGPLGLWLTKLLEQFGFSISHHVVVRSQFHRDWLASRGISADVIPDGVDTAVFQPREDPDVRRRYGLDGVFTIGLLGSVIWNEKRQTCYGSELLEVIDRLRHRPVKGLLIGDGSGLPRLKERCAALGLEDRMIFMGRVPYQDLPPLLNLMDVCLSTQTDDLPGRVRTTGKLPLYLACGRYVLASAVGDARQVLPAEMQVEYHGTKDEQYASRLADRVMYLLDHPEKRNQVQAARAIARSQFDYGLLSERLRSVLHQAVAGKPARAVESSPGNV